MTKKGRGLLRLDHRDTPCPTGSEPFSTEVPWYLGEGRRFMTLPRSFDSISLLVFVFSFEADKGNSRSGVGQKGGGRPTL